MQMMSLPPLDASTIEAGVTIHCAVDKVFRFYRDFQNLPLGDVIAVAQTGPAASRWTIQGPLGIRAHWTIKSISPPDPRLVRRTFAKS
jgi:uncharacterized membrane protein